MGSRPTSCRGHFSLWVSHSLHGGRSDADGKWDTMTEDRRTHIDVRHIAKNTRNDVIPVDHDSRIMWRILTTTDTSYTYQAASQEQKGAIAELEGRIDYAQIDIGLCTRKNTSIWVDGLAAHLCLMAVQPIGAAHMLWSPAELKRMFYSGARTSGAETRGTAFFFHVSYLYIHKTC